ncbi:hypothetical protein BJX70DRAFT_403119 [Aspergillus crustosus]
MTLDMPDKTHPYFTVSSDPDLPRPRANIDEEARGGPSGPWPGLYPVRIMKPGRFMEALCWLWIRDCRGVETPLWELWNKMLWGMATQWMSVEGTPGRSGSLRQMTDDFRRAIKWYGSGYRNSVDRW